MRFLTASLCNKSSIQHFFVFLCFCLFVYLSGSLSGPLWLSLALTRSVLGPPRRERVLTVLLISCKKHVFGFICSFIWRNWDLRLQTMSQSPLQKLFNVMCTLGTWTEKTGLCGENSQRGGRGLTQTHPIFFSVFSNSGAYKMAKKR